MPDSGAAVVDLMSALRRSVERARGGAADDDAADDPAPATRRRRSRAPAKKAAAEKAGREEGPGQEGGAEGRGQDHRRRRRRPRRRPPRTSRRPSAPAAAPDVPRPRGRREDPLAEYRAKRDPARTAEPVPAAGSALPSGNDDTFVVQEHHTPRGRTGERVHWDLRLERDGVLKSWAVPKGPADEPGANRLAVPTEDHPLEYASFSRADRRRRVRRRARHHLGRRPLRHREVGRAAHHRDLRRPPAGRPVRAVPAGRRRLEHPQAGLRRRPARAHAGRRRRCRCSRRAGRAPPPDGGRRRWGYEFKWDGVRAVAAVARRGAGPDLAQGHRHHRALPGGGPAARGAGRARRGRRRRDRRHGRRRPPRLRRAAEPDAPHRARGAADGRRRSRSPTWSSTCSPGTARTCSGVPYARAPRAPGRPRRSPGTAGWPRRGSRGRSRRTAASQENGLEGVVAKRLDSRLPAGAARPRLAQGQELPDAGGRRRRLAARAGPAGRRDRVAAVRRPGRRGPAGLRRPRRHRLHRPGPARPASACSPRGRPRPFHGALPARRHPGRALGASPTWSARSPTPCGRRTAGCGIPRGAGVRDDLEPDDVVVEP